MSLLWLLRDSYMGWYVKDPPFVIDDGFPENGKWQSKATVNGKPGVDVNIGIIRNQFRYLCPPLLSHVQGTDTKDMLKTNYDDNKPISLVWSPLLSISIIITVSVNWTPLLLLHLIPWILFLELFLSFKD